jgi:hypothetical protein
MPFEKFDLVSLNKERRKAIAKSIRTISVEELKKLGGELFHYAEDPWRETFFRFIAENPRRHTPSRGHQRRGQYCLLPRQRQRHVVPAWERHGSIASEGTTDHEGDDRGSALSSSMAGFAPTT